MPVKEKIVKDFCNFSKLKENIYFWRTDFNNKEIVSKHNWKSTAKSFTITPRYQVIKNTYQHFFQFRLNFIFESVE